MIAPVSEILETPELKGLKWVILDNQVFELKNFTHPGGNFILKQLTGNFFTMEFFQCFKGEKLEGLFMA